MVELALHSTLLVIYLPREHGHQSVKENDFLLYSLPAYGALSDLVSTQLTRAMAAEEHTVLASVHAHLALSLNRQTHNIFKSLSENISLLYNYYTLSFISCSWFCKMVMSS